MVLPFAVTLPRIADDLVRYTAGVDRVTNIAFASAETRELEPRLSTVYVVMLLIDMFMEHHFKNLIAQLMKKFSAFLYSRVHDSPPLSHIVRRIQSTSSFILDTF
jgi:hypothetical protein